MKPRQRMNQASTRVKRVGTTPAKCVQVARKSRFRPPCAMEISCGPQGRDQSKKKERRVNMSAGSAARRTGAVGLKQRLIAKLDRAPGAQSKNDC